MGFFGDMLPEVVDSFVSFEDVAVGLERSVDDIYFVPTFVVQQRERLDL